MPKETPLPKMYIYSIEGLFDKSGNLRKFSVPSLSRDLNDEFDLESVAYNAALMFYLDNEEYQDIEKWPLVFKFYKTKTDQPIDLEMELSFAPTFLSKQKSIVKIIDAPSEKEKTEVVDSPVRKTKEVDKFVEYLSSYENFIAVLKNTKETILHGCVLKDIQSFPKFLSSLKSESQTYIPIVIIKHKNKKYIIKIDETFYDSLEAEYFSTTLIAEEGEYPEFLE